MSDIPSDKSLGRHMQPRKTSTRINCEGGSDPTKLLGGSSAKKWGRSRPIRPFLRGDFCNCSRCKSFRTNSVSQEQGEEVGNSESAVRNSYRLHPIHLFPSPISFRILRRTRAKHGMKCLLGLERPPRFPWQRSGVAPAQHGVLLAAKVIVVLCGTSSPWDTCPSAPVTARVMDRVICVLHAPVTLHSGRND